MTTVIHLIAAARPNFMKVAPLYHALKKETWCRPMLVHTGQHYDANMSDAFLRDLALPAPDIHLGVGSGSHAEQTAAVMVAYEKICLANRPDLTVVVGDVNSTIAATLAAKKLGITVAHLEAGLRSRDWGMPEEINRLATDAISDILWTPSPDADENLAHEGVAPERVVRVGNIMMDSYELMRARIEKARTRDRFGLAKGRYGVVTLHRPSNVDRKETLGPLVDTLIAVAARVPLVFAVHPRTRASLEKFALMEKLKSAPGIHLAEPMGYIEFMGLVTEAKLAITDSGGIQEETTYLGIPCLTLRENTERPITVTEGTNRLVKLADLMRHVGDVESDKWPVGRRPALWDGKAAERIVADLRKRAAKTRTPQSVAG
jgi:UDP-N-acetylglucosamine 2-epimerase (non-hydrolysing)